MTPAGIGLIILGYALFYSGTSNLMTGGKGTGFLQGLGVKGGSNNSLNIAGFLGDITAAGNSGASSPTPADSPVTGTVPVSPVTPPSSGGGGIISI